MAWLQPTERGVLVHVQVTPNASRNMIEAAATRDDGQPRLRVKVRALPAENAANEAVCALLAKWADVPKSSVSMVRGATSRQKTIALAGIGAALSARLESLAAALAEAPFVAR